MKKIEFNCKPNLNLASNSFFAIFLLILIPSFSYFLFISQSSTPKDLDIFYRSIKFVSFFLVINVANLFRTEGYFLDPLNQVGGTSCGVFRPIFKKYFHFSDVVYVSLTVKHRSGHLGDDIYYPIYLRLSDGKEINLFSFEKNYSLARLKAVEIARKCQFDFLDKDTGLISTPGKTKNSL